MENVIIKLKNNKYFIFDPISLKIYISKKEVKDSLEKQMQEQVVPEKREYLANLTLGMTDNCNLMCKYCYENSGEKKSCGLITTKQLINIYEKVIKIYPKGIKAICFFGGEPLLAKKQIKEFVEYVDSKVKENKKLIKTSFGIITNGTLIDEEVLNMFNKYHFNVTISLDGPKEMNDKNRIFKASSKSVYETVKSNIQGKMNGKFNVFCEATISINYLKNYKGDIKKEFINGLTGVGLRNIWPFIEESKDIDYNQEILKKVDKFYGDFCDYYLNLLLTEKYMEVPVTLVSKITNILRKKRRTVCQAGKNLMFVNYKDQVFPCQVCGSCNWQFFGNINEVTKLRERINNYVVPNRSSISQCQTCFATSLCESWCSVGSYLNNGRINTVVPIRCHVEKLLIGKILCFVAKCLEEDKKDLLTKKIIDYSKNVDINGVDYSYIV